MDFSPPKPRRFVPEPIETTTTKPKRRFAPQPIETSSKSSQPAKARQSDTPTGIENFTQPSTENDPIITKERDSRKEQPDVTPTSHARPVRRFAPQPIETSTRQSNRREGDAGSGLPSPDMESPASGTGRRRFAPQAIENTIKSSRKQEDSPADEEDLAPMLPYEASLSAPSDEPQPTRRRFIPQPVESTVTTSRYKPRHKESRDGDDAFGLPKVKEVEVDAPKIPAPPARRRFAPEPTDVSSRSSKPSRQTNVGRKDEDDEAPLLSHESELSAPSPASPVSPERRRFTPQLADTTSRQSRNVTTKTTASSMGSDPSDRVPLLPHEMELGPPPDSPVLEKPKRRKFSPQLVETAKRSRKAGDTSPAIGPTDKTNISPQDVPARTSRVEQLRFTLPDSVRSPDGSPTRTFGTRSPGPRSKQHSYRVPDLPPIESSESEESSRSQSISLAHREDSDTSDETWKNAIRQQEDSEELSSGYLLDLAARSAEKQLRDQAAAAFVNSDYHEPVAHYVDNSDSEDDVPQQPVLQSGKASRYQPIWRDSADEKMDLKEMQRHAERLQLHSTNKKSATHRYGRHASKQEEWPSMRVAGPMGSAVQKPKKMIGGHQRDPDLKQMRKAASPPMLGNDIEFPRCTSPDHARFDVTQGADFLRKQMCYLSQEVEEQTPGLWTQSVAKTNRPAALNLTGISNFVIKTTHASPANSHPQTPTVANESSGLWGGYCTQQDSRQAQLPSGLMTPQRTPSQTPQFEKDDPFASLNFSPPKAPAVSSPKSTLAPLRRAVVNAATSSRDSGQRTPRKGASPTSTIRGSGQQTLGLMAAVDARLELDAKVDAQCGDAFITQVYNYLSLGYPSLARKYDDELSRIARIGVDELRMDDKLASENPKGHIRLGEDVDFEDAGKGRDGGRVVEPVDCRRWRALRKYVREWARQMLKKEKEEGVNGEGMLDPHRAWGLPARRGSWGN